MKYLAQVIFYAYFLLFNSCSSKTGVQINKEDQLFIRAKAIILCCNGNKISQLIDKYHLDVDKDSIKIGNGHWQRKSQLQVSDTTISVICIYNYNNKPIEFPEECHYTEGVVFDKKTLKPLYPIDHYGAINLTGHKTCLKE